MEEGLPERDHIPGSLQEHFMYRHWKAQGEIVQDGPAPLPRCPICDMHMHMERLIKHQITDRCDQEMEIRLRRRFIVLEIQSGGWDFFAS